MSKHRIAVFKALGDGGSEPLKYINCVISGVVGFSGKRASKYQAFQTVRYNNDAHAVYHSHIYGYFIRLPRGLHHDVLPRHQLNLQDVLERPTTHPGNDCLRYAL